MNANEQSQMLLVLEEKLDPGISDRNFHFPHNHTKWQNRVLGQCNETACLVPETQIKHVLRKKIIFSQIIISIKIYYKYKLLKPVMLILNLITRVEYLFCALHKTLEFILLFAS